MQAKLRVLMSYEDMMGVLLDLREYQDVCKDHANPEYVNHEKWQKRWEEVEVRKMRLVKEIAKAKVV